MVSSYAQGRARGRSGATRLRRSPAPSQVVPTRVPESRGHEHPVAPRALVPTGASRPDPPHRRDRRARATTRRATLEPSVRRLHALSRATTSRSRWRITIADNASTDRTWASRGGWRAELAACGPAPRAKGRGPGAAGRRGRRATPRSSPTWTSTSRPTSRALLPLVAPLVSGPQRRGDRHPARAGARVVRGPKRELISRGYNLLAARDAARRASPTPSAASRRSAPTWRGAAAARRGRRLVLRHRAAGAGGAQRPADPRGAGRLGRGSRLARRRGAHRGRRPARHRPGGVADRARRPPSSCRPPPASRRTGGAIGQLLRFAAIGVVSTGAYLVLYLLLGMWMPSLAANALALALSAIGNTAANRSITFERGGRRHLVRHHVRASPSSCSASA